MGQERWILVGKIVRTHGLRGFVALRSYTDPVDNILDYEPWVRLGRDGSVAETYAVEECQVTPKHILVRFEGVSSVEQAARFISQEIHVARSTLPDDGIYWVDLVGMVVVDAEGRDRGTISEMDASPGSDLMRVAVPGGKSELIPFIEDKVVLKIDMEARVVHIDWPHPDEQITV